MRYAVTLATFGTVAHHGGRHDRQGLTLAQARKLVDRAARRGARRFGAPAHSFAAKFAQVHASHMALAALARSQGRTALALEHVEAARRMRLMRPAVEREESKFGAPQRSGFIEAQAWGAHGGAFPIAYVAGVISLEAR